MVHFIHKYCHLCVINTFVYFDVEATSLQLWAQPDDNVNVLTQVKFVVMMFIRDKCSRKAKTRENVVINEQ